MKIHKILNGFYYMVFPDMAETGEPHLPHYKWLSPFRTQVKRPWPRSRRNPSTLPPPLPLSSPPSPPTPLRHPCPSPRHARSPPSSACGSPCPSRPPVFASGRKGGASGSRRRPRHGRRCWWRRSLGTLGWSCCGGSPTWTAPTTSRRRSSAPRSRSATP